MLFAFLDEQENSVLGRRYTAVTAAVFKEESLLEYQDRLIRTIFTINKRYTTSDFYEIPVLHASDLPQNWSDDQKVEIFHEIFKLCRELDVSFYRVGYFNDSLKLFHKKRYEIVDFCLLNVRFPIQFKLNEPIFYIYELSLNARRNMQGFNRTPDREKFQTDLSLDSYSLKNFDKILGNFYADKHNHHMYASDFFGWAVSQVDKISNSVFKKRITESLSHIENNVCFNSIIEFKPYSDATPEELSISSDELPLRFWSRITPS